PVPSKSSWPISRKVMGLIAGTVLLIWLVPQMARSLTAASPAPLPTSAPAARATSAATLAVAAASAAATSVPPPTSVAAAAGPLATPGIPSDWSKKVAGFNWASPIPTTENDFELINRHLENGVLTWLITAKKGLSQPNWDTQTQLG